MSFLPHFTANQTMGLSKSYPGDWKTAIASASQFELKHSRKKKKKQRVTFWEVNVGILAKQKEEKKLTVQWCFI